MGVGGEDRHGVEICGVDPKTRGRRTDESLSVLRPLLAGELVAHHGELFDFDAARILPAARRPVPITIGGRSNAAVRRAGRFGDGWLGVWCSPKRYAEVVRETAAIAAEAGRGPVDWHHGLQVWTACDPDRDLARARLATAMEDMYRTPFARFERYSPAGSAAESDERAIDAVAEVRRRLV